MDLIMKYIIIGLWLIVAIALYGNIIHDINQIPKYNDLFKVYKKSILGNIIGILAIGFMVGVLFTNVVNIKF